MGGVEGKDVEEVGGPPGGGCGVEPSEFGSGPVEAMEDRMMMMMMMMRFRKEKRHEDEEENGKKEEGEKKRERERCIL